MGWIKKCMLVWLFRLFCCHFVQFLFLNVFQSDNNSNIVSFLGHNYLFGLSMSPLLVSWANWLSVRPKTYLCPQTKTLLFYSSLSGVGMIGSLQITYQVSLKIHQYPCIFLGEKMHFESKLHSCFLLEITNKIAPNVWLKPIP